MSIDISEIRKIFQQSDSKEAVAYCYNIDDDIEEVGFITYDIFAGGPVRIG